MAIKILPMSWDYLLWLKYLINEKHTNSILKVRTLTKLAIKMREDVSVVEITKRHNRVP